MTELADQRAERLARLRERRAGPSPADGASLPTHPSATGVTVEMPVAPTTSGRSPRRTSPAATAKIVTVGASTTAVLGLVAGYGFADRVNNADQVMSSGTAIAALADESAGTPDPQAATLAPPAAAGQPPVTAPPQIIVVVIDGTTGRPITTIDESRLDETVRTEPTSAQAAPAATTVPAPQPPAPPVAIDLAVPAPPAPQPAPAEPAPAPAPVQATTGGS